MVSPNKTFQQHLREGLLGSTWLILFLLLIAPFDAAELSIRARFLIMPIYGLIFLLMYILLWPARQFLNRQFETKSPWPQVLFLALFYLVSLGPIFAYYRSSIVNGAFPFSVFLTRVYLPTLVLLTILLYLLQQFRKPQLAPQKRILRGANKEDLLQLDPANLVGVSSAQNYVLVYYLQQGKLEKQLLRTTLRQVQETQPDLVRIHRSHLINPVHFVRWLQHNQILVHELELPVSNSYRQLLLDQLGPTN